MTDYIPPQDDIGPVYKALGFVALFAVLAIIGWQAAHGNRIGLHDVLLFGVTALVCLALIRPDKFDSVMKTIGDKLPMFSFTKDK